MIMHGRKYSKIETTDYLKGEFIGDVPNWDGTQPQIEDPNNHGEFIDDPEIGITDKKPKAGCYLHIFDEATETWGEGKTQSELDAIRLEKDKQAALSELQATDKEMARVGEDLLDVLIAKGILSSSDLPQNAQDKLSQRKALRAKL